MIKSDMKEIVNFLYFSVLNLVPEKAIYGREYSACSIFALSNIFLINGMFVLFHYIIDSKVNGNFFTIFFIISILFLFFIINKLFLSKEVQDDLKQKFASYSKTTLKLVGFLYILFC